MYKIEFIDGLKWAPTVKVAEIENLQQFNIKIFIRDQRIV